jgi:activator of HSP90 ATPase
VVAKNSRRKGVEVKGAEEDEEDEDVEEVEVKQSGKKKSKASTEAAPATSASSSSSAPSSSSSAAAAVSSSASSSSSAAQSSSIVERSSEEDKRIQVATYVSRCLCHPWSPHPPSLPCTPLLLHSRDYLAITYPFSLSFPLPPASAILQLISCIAFILLSPSCSLCFF